MQSNRADVAVLGGCSGAKDLSRARARSSFLSGAGHDALVVPRSFRGAELRYGGAVVRRRNCTSEVAACHMAACMTVSLARTSWLDT